MVSYRVFSNAPVTRSFTSTPRARRAWRQEERRIAAQLFLAAYQHGIARINQDRVNRDAGERAHQEANYHYQLAAEQDPPSSPLPSPPSSAALQVPEDLMIGPIPLLSGEEMHALSVLPVPDAMPVPVPSLREAASRPRGHAEDAPTISLHSIASTGSAPLSWGPRRPAPGAPNPLRTQARDVSPVRRMPPLSTAQRRLFNSPPSSPLQDPNPPYSPTAPSTGPSTPIGSVRPFIEEPFTPQDPSYSPTPAQPYSPAVQNYQPRVLPFGDEVRPSIMWHGALDVNDFMAQLAALELSRNPGMALRDAEAVVMEAFLDAQHPPSSAAPAPPSSAPVESDHEVPAGPGVDITDGSELFPIDLTDDSNNGSKECPIAL